jgi:hypothetical protein
MDLIINPGTGPVGGATREQAEANIAHLLVDANAEGAGVRFVHACTIYGTDDPDGRFSFALTLDGRECEVDMPGIPIDRVRFTGAADQNIWDFPRLYVNGSSWVWIYAVGSVADALHGEDPNA